MEDSAQSGTSPASTPSANPTGPAPVTPPTGATASSTLGAPPTSSPIQPAKPKGKFPLAAVVGIIVFLVTGGIVGFLYKDQLMGIGAKPTPTPAPQKVSTPYNQASEFKTFMSKNYGFSFDYPSSGFELGDENEKVIDEAPAEGTVYNIYGCLGLCEAYPSTFTVDVFENKQKWSLTQWLNNSYDRPLKITDNPLDNSLVECINKDSRTKKTSETFLGRDAKLYIYYMDKETLRMKEEGICDKDLFIGGAGASIKSIYFEKNGKIFHIKHAFGSQEEISFFTRILSTFKFTGSTSIPEVSPKSSTKSAN